MGGVRGEGRLVTKWAKDLSTLWPPSGLQSLTSHRKVHIPLRNRKELNVQLSDILTQWIMEMLLLTTKKLLLSSQEEYSKVMSILVFLKMPFYKVLQLCKMPIVLAIIP